MKAITKQSGGQPSLLVDSEVVRKIRQHARSVNSTEICGVLIGTDKDRRIEVTASIEGQNAEEAGAHVTFTQDTWEHIYAVKDKQYPSERIVGWYHSHPGFGVFLSEHDTFIHKNFFSSPGQVAWVFDPHSDEEGCFGWVDGRIERLSRLAVVDRRGGEKAEHSGARDDEGGVFTEREDGSSEPQPDYPRVRVARGVGTREKEDSSTSLEQLVAKVFFSLSLVLLGGLLSWYFLPHTEVLPVLIDPRGNLIDARTGDIVGRVETQDRKPAPADLARPTPATNAPSPNPAADSNANATPDASGKKNNDAKPK